MVTTTNQPQPPLKKMVTSPSCNDQYEDINTPPPQKATTDQVVIVISILVIAIVWFSFSNYGIKQYGCQTNAGPGMYVLLTMLNQLTGGIAGIVMCCQYWKVQYINPAYLG